MAVLWRSAISRSESSEAEIAAGRPWEWVPAPWQRQLGWGDLVAKAPRQVLADGVTLFHDGSGAAVLRQVEQGGRAHGVALSSQGENGSFLSIVFDLPDASARHLRPWQIVRLQCRISAEPAAPRLYARFNLSHGPNIETLVREVDGQGAAEFDLAYCPMEVSRIEKAWIDLIFEGGCPPRAVLSDLCIARRPRGGF
ncbi:DUF6478 family protein [Halodurantibacterium flavum]|uniref:DUF6478 family protein n=1 Tax=Halodurantibacterium flavum TaxID=1382802 RepID=A0ABW4S9E7_9RHOB